MDRGGRPFFIELNPNGEWGWLQRAGLPVAQLLADALTNREPGIDVLTRIGEYVFPAIVAYFAQVERNPPAFDPDRWLAILDVASVDAAQAAARIYEQEMDRIQLLEGKLGRHGPTITLLAPLEVGAVGLGAIHGHVIGTSLGILALIYLVAAALATFKAGAATERHMVIAEDVDGAADHGRSISQWIAAVELACAISNRPCAIELNNWIHVTQISLVWSAGLAGGAVFLLGAAGFPR